MNISNENFEDISLKIKKQQEIVKKDMKPNFVSQLREILDLCFMMPKSRKEHFITKDKLSLNILKLVQSQKKFKPSENVFNQIRYLSAFDLERQLVGKIINIDLINCKVEFITLSDVINNQPHTIKSFSEVHLFDYNSISMEYYYAQQKNYFGDISYLELYNFLSGSEFKRMKSNINAIAPEEDNEEVNEQIYGTEVTNTENHPVMLEIAQEYDLPTEQIKKEKKKLHKLDSVTMEVLETFNSVKEASDILGISASTISNVLCQGKSAMKYTEAGTFKWEYSDVINSKYGVKGIVKFKEMAVA